jgi:hypothetical protein
VDARVHARRDADAPSRLRRKTRRFRHGAKRARRGAACAKPHARAVCGCGKLSGLDTVRNYSKPRVRAKPRGELRNNALISLEKFDSAIAPVCRAKIPFLFLRRVGDDNT